VNCCDHLSIPCTTVCPPLSLYSSRHPPDLHSFPTRRSSDLQLTLNHGVYLTKAVGGTPVAIDAVALWKPQLVVVDIEMRLPERRSEEHTSELQSRFDLVCRLLLEKKKKKIIIL